MYYIVYLSTGTNYFSEEELTGILSVSVANNTRDNITGILLYNRGNFIQLLEGEETTVRDTFKRIAADNRHTSIITITGGELKQRNFPDWAMGFKSIKTETLKELKGYFKPAIQTSSPDNDNFSVSLLNAFLRASRMV